jgi:hypothetical protein
MEAFVANRAASCQTAQSAVKLSASGEVAAVSESSQSNVISEASGQRGRFGFMASLTSRLSKGTTVTTRFPSTMSAADEGNDAEDGEEASKVQVQIELASQQRVDAMVGGGDEGGHTGEPLLVI